MSAELHIVHCHEAAHELPPALAAVSAAGTALVMHTCQRTVAITTDAEVARSSFHAMGGGGAVEFYDGVAANGFLLRLASGLESKLAGETEIFGQLKEAWATFSVRDVPLARALGGTMQRLFRDVKQVRSQYLSGIGSASYGSMVRRLLDADAPAVGGARPVLLVGAGQIAHAVAPWIEGSELWIWNRSQAKAEALAIELQRRAPQRVIKVLPATGAAELAAWHTAHDVVVCIPADAERDSARAAAWLSGGDARGRLIHLGVDGSAPLGVWSSANRLLHLADVYRLLRESNEARRAQIERARAACDALAREWHLPRGAGAYPPRLRRDDRRVS